MSWIVLAAAGLLEIVWAVAMKRSEGLTRPVETAVFVVALIASMLLLSRALRDLPVGTGYAVWTGIGAIGTAVIGVVVLGESATPLRLASVVLLATGIAGLAVASGSH